MKGQTQGGKPLPYVPDEIALAQRLFGKKIPHNFSAKGYNAVLKVFH
jgi:hypothetical protein